MIIYSFFVEGQLLELCEFKIEIVISVVVDCGGVCGIVNWAIGLYKRLTREQIVALIVFGHSDIERTIDAFVLSKLEIGPLLIIEKLFQRLLQIIENRDVCALNLAVVDGHTSL